VEVCKPMAPPKLLLVDPMATLHLPVLLGPPRPNVAMPDAGRFDRKHEVEGKLSAVIALQLADPEGERPLELDQERQAGALVKPSVEAQDPKARAVVQGRVLERPASRNLHELNVHLDAFARLRLLEELHLPGDPLPRPPKTRDAEIAKNALDRAHGNADVVNAAKPELSPGGAVGEFPARLADRLDDRRGHAAAPTTGITRDEPLEAPLAPPHAPAPNRPHADPESACGRCRPMEPCEVEHHQSLSYSPPVLHPHLHIAQSNHRSPPLRQLGCPSKQRRSISGRYFSLLSPDLTLSTLRPKISPVTARTSAAAGRPREREAMQP